MLNMLYIKGNRILLNQYLLRKMLFYFAKFINQRETNEKITSRMILMRPISIHVSQWEKNSDSALTLMCDGDGDLNK